MDSDGAASMYHETRLPYFYDDWYLPLIEAGASMPNAIGGTLA